MAKRKKYDWEAIEKDYRAGQLSIREVAKIHGCSEGAIRKKMKSLGVERDLSSKVAQKVRNDLVRNEVRTANPETESEIIEMAAATQVEVVRSHRKGISSGQKNVEKLQLALSKAVDDKEITIQQGASTAVQLSTALKNLISLERQAFNIQDEKEEKEEKFAVSITPMDAAL